MYVFGLKLLKKRKSDRALMKRLKAKVAAKQRKLERALALQRSAQQRVESAEQEEKSLRERLNAVERNNSQSTLAMRALEGDMEDLRHQLAVEEEAGAGYEHRLRELEEQVVEAEARAEENEAESTSLRHEQVSLAGRASGHAKIAAWATVTCYA